MEHLIPIVQTYGYWILLPLSIIEGPIVGILAGFLVSLGQLDWFLVFIVLLIGDLVGDIIYYGLGRWGKNATKSKVIRYLGGTEERIRAFENYFTKNSFSILLFGKTQAIGSVILIVAGMMNIPFGRFVWYNFLLTVPKTILFQVAGFYFGEAFKTDTSLLSYASAFSLLIFITLVGGYFIMKRYIKKREEVMTGISPTE